MKRQISVYVEEDILLAFQVGSKRRRTSVSEEVERLMRIQVMAWGERCESGQSDKESVHG